MGSLFDLIYLNGVQFCVEETIEGRTRQRSAGAVGELLHSPVLKSWLFVVQENTAVLDSRRAMGASRRRDEERVVFSGRDIRPPNQPSTQPLRSKIVITYQYHGETPEDSKAPGQLPPMRRMMK